MSEFSVLGKSVPRKDAVEKVKGEAAYIPNIQLPKMLHARFLRSPHAHARIKSIDTSRAEALPGVKCILTYKNVPQAFPLRKIELLLDQTVHHPGEEVAAVAAITPEIAEEALKLIKVEFEVLPAVFDPEEAMKPGAPLVHLDYNSNIYRGSRARPVPGIGENGWMKFDYGNVERGFSEADFVIDGTLVTPMQYPCSPLPRSCVCEWMGDKLTCWADTQLPLDLLQDLSRNLGIPQSNIRLIAHYAVGGYGGKSPEKTATLAAIMAKRTSRPVKAVYSRAEDFIDSHRRISYKNYNKIGVKKDGSITAFYSRIISHIGNDTAAPYVAQRGAISGACSILYKFQNSRAETTAVLTNVVDYGAMNGFGSPEAIYAIELLIDQAAEKINMDPLEFRYKNCMRYGDKALGGEGGGGPAQWDGILGPDIDSFPEIIQQCGEKADWKEKWRGWRTPMSVEGYKRRGIGLALGMHVSGYMPSSAIVKMNQDGGATVLSGAVEIGQGYGTICAQIAAETLGLRYEDVNVILADTGSAPAARGNVGNMGTSSGARAVHLAAEDARKKLFELAAPRLKVTPDQLELKDRHIWIKATDTKIPIADICMTNWQITGSANNPPGSTIRDEKTSRIIRPYVVACTIAEVEVDVETGKLDVLRFTSGHDCGRAINPIMVENQISLGLVMANGWLHTEEYLIDPKTGIVMNPNLLDYKLTTFLDIPPNENVVKIIAERPCAWGPYGAKGFSETAVTAAGPAIVNAIYNATGVRIYSGFLSPANVLKALKQSGY